MSYKTFVILPLTVDCCHWDSESNSLIASGQRTIYKIIDPVTEVVYGLKRTLAMAKRAIDTNGQRWQMIRG